MSLVTSHVFHANFNGIDLSSSGGLPGPVSIPGLKVGDIVLAVVQGNSRDEGLFAAMVTTDDELEQTDFHDYTATTFKAVFFRGT